VSTLELEHIKHADLASGNNISLTSAGNVGVGAAPVAGDFEVHCASGGELRVDNYGASGVLIKQLNGGSGTSGSMMMQGGTSIILATNDTNEAMRINSSGNVGIGSSSPVRQLEIKDDGTRGQAIVGIIADAGDPAGIFMGTTSNNNVGGIRYFTDTNKLTLRANDEDRLLIDSAGRVTKPYQPSFRVGSVTYLTSGNTILHTIDFHDIGNNYNPANGRFTAPVAGVYYFGAQAISGSASTSSEQNLRFMKNSTAVCDARARSYVESSLHLKTVIELAAGDYIYVVVDAGSVYASSNGFHNQFMGYLIG
jgi:hypothetical protein